MKPTPAAWSEVRAALTSKWEGVQSAGCRVLGTWGGEEAVGELRTFLSRTWNRKRGWAIRGVAVETLRRVARPGDVDWILDAYFAVPGVLRKHELLPLVLSLDLGSARDRLLREVSSTNRDNRQAAMKAFCNMPYPREERLTVLRGLLRDRDREIREGARLIQRTVEA